MTRQENEEPECYSNQGVRLRAGGGEVLREKYKFPSSTPQPQKIIG